MKAGKISTPRILLIDLNNFARYPTLSVGYLAAILRREQMHVDVFSPLSTGVTGVVREPHLKPWSYWIERAKYRTAVSRSPWIKSVRERLTHTALHAPKLERQANVVAANVAKYLDQTPYDAVLISTYLIYHDLCRKIAARCQQRGVPVLIGGPYFAQPEVREQWLNIPGTVGLVGGEVELELGNIVRAMVAGESLSKFEGVWSDDPHKPEAVPLQDLDSLPFPDFSDFPWSKYPNRIIPMVTGRGCGWGACTFCSDITGTAGRTFRSRSPENVLEEIGYQTQRFDTELFAFTDPKLNSNRSVWDALLTQMPQRAPNARWLGAVHIDAHRKHGLDAQELRAARAAGLVRMTTGLESGSQRMLDLMKKGTELSASSETIRNATNADISVRVTMILGYPGERADDVLATATFLEKHSDAIERVVLNRFHIRTGTRFHRMYQQDPGQFPDIVSVSGNHRIANLDHESTLADDPSYRRAITRVIGVAHDINRRPLRSNARAFDGVM